MYMSMIICLSSCAPHGFEFFCMDSIHGLLEGSGLVVKWFMVVLGVDFGGSKWRFKGRTGGLKFYIVQCVFTVCRLNDRSLALSQNVVVSIYSSDTILISLKCTCWLPLNNAPAAYHQVVHLLVFLRSSTCWFLAQDHLLNHTKAKRCRINLSKRHRFAIANSRYHLLVNSSLRLDFFLYNVTLTLASGSSIDWIYCSFLLIDDVTDDFIYA
ncbi:hypothetical protein F511_39667 [Dorcoceras hygrometricum]|uniref:Uncharacterized protein n=1 Tax=Dorcoceras hygrometricum TaxID=472368 RepID=A0A2Z7D5R5_9LAMI|nr:hypothetical protein F511_39667 [Dorcoceras hygrometricum]